MSWKEIITIPKTLWDKHRETWNTMQEEIMTIIEKISIQTWEIVSIDELIKYILETTTGKFQKIYNHKKECFLIEALARPNIEAMWVDKNEKNPQIIALLDFLKLIEKTDTTFLLFEHMLGLIENEIKKSANNKIKYSINAYPEDILDPNFLQLIEEFPYPEKLVIELTEKEKWSDGAIQKLYFIQEEYHIRIALDDINPNPSELNYTMDTLNKCKYTKLTLDLGKIDWPHFQELAQKDDYDWLKARILDDFHESWIQNVIIEYVETEEQFIFAKQLENDKDLQDLGIRIWYQWFYFDD